MSITQKMIDGAFARSEDRRNGLERDYLQKIGHLRSKSEDFHNLKCARVTAFILENYSVEIDEGELLFGRYTTAFRPTPAMEDEYRAGLPGVGRRGRAEGSERRRTGTGRRPEKAAENRREGHPARDCRGKAEAPPPTTAQM